jgi:hypothetical protein
LDLARLREEAVDGLSMLQTPLDRDFAAANMRLASSMTAAKEIAGWWWCCLWRGIVKTGEFIGRSGILQIGPLGSCLLILFLLRYYV